MTSDEWDELSRRQHAANPSCTWPDCCGCEGLDMCGQEKSVIVKVALARLAATAEIEPEQGHSDADDVLCAALRALGACEIADAFQIMSAKFWYSQKDDEDD